MVRERKITAIGSSQVVTLGTRHPAAIKAAKTSSVVYSQSFFHKRQMIKIAVVTRFVPTSANCAMYAALIFNANKTAPPAINPITKYEAA